MIEMFVDKYNVVQFDHIDRYDLDNMNDHSNRNHSMLIRFSNRIRIFVDHQFDRVCDLNSRLW